jgi:hypothetical protein
MTRETLRAVGFRLPTSVIERIDAFARQLEAEQPGIRVSRSNAIRTLLERGLADAGYPAEQPLRKARSK